MIIPPYQRQPCLPRENMSDPIWSVFCEELSTCFHHIEESEGHIYIKVGYLGDALYATPGVTATYNLIRHVTSMLDSTGVLERINQQNVPIEQTNKGTALLSVMHAINSSSALEWKGSYRDLPENGIPEGQYRHFKWVLGDYYFKDCCHTLAKYLQSGPDDIEAQTNIQTFISCISRDSVTLAYLAHMTEGILRSKALAQITDEVQAMRDARKLSLLDSWDMLRKRQEQYRVANPVANYGLWLYDREYVRDHLSKFGGGGKLELNAEASDAED